jgi:hypothetical protein
MSHPPPLFTLTAALGSKWAESMPALDDMVVFPWLSAALLNYYKGTQMVDVDEDLAGVMASSTRR